MAELEAEKTSGTFRMRCKVSAKLPLIKRFLPDFAPVFERYAADLKSAAEASPSA